MDLVIATRNKNKIVEIKDILKNFDINIKSLNDFGPIPEVIEDADTFEANAYKKASFTSRVLGLPCLADDSGLCVEALNNAPGVFSARYAGNKAKDKDNVKKLLSEMKNKENRKAFFHCVISIAVPTGAALTYEASCHGLITHKVTGSTGFGYDPVFFYPPLSKTFSEIPLWRKNEVSHRGLALKELCFEFNKVLIWLEQNMPKFVRKMDDNG